MVKKARLTTRQKECKKINRKRAVRRWWQITSRRLVIVLILVTSLSATAASWWFWRSGRLEAGIHLVSDAMWQQTAALGFAVDKNKVLLEGRKFSPLADITTAINIDGGEPILAISLDDMRRRLMAVPRVKSASIERVLPDQLHIHIVEREPVAVWQNDSKLYLLDDDGKLMENIDPKNYTNLLLVVGEDAPQHTHNLMLALAEEPELYKNIVAALRVGERRWNIRFKNGIELKLPEQEESKAWKNFVQLNREHHLLDRAITSVDMRLTDRVFIKVTPSNTPPQKNSGRET